MIVFPARLRYPTPHPERANAPAPTGGPAGRARLHCGNAHPQRCGHSGLLRCPVHTRNSREGRGDAPTHDHTVLTIHVWKNLTSALRPKIRCLLYCHVPHFCKQWISVLYKTKSVCKILSPPHSRAIFTYIEPSCVVLISLILVEVL